MWQLLSDSTAMRAARHALPACTRQISLDITARTCHISFDITTVYIFFDITIIRKGAHAKCPFQQYQISWPKPITTGIA